MDSEETLILGQTRPEDLAAVLPDLVDEFDERMRDILSHPPPALPPGKVLGKT